MAQRLLLTRDALWYRVCPDQPVRVVVSRDPKGREKDDVFFTTDLTMAPGVVVSHYFGRWPVEDTFRNCKQSLGAEEPQAWKGKGSGTGRDPGVLDVLDGLGLVSRDPGTEAHGAKTSLVSEEGATVVRGRGVRAEGRAVTGGDFLEVRGNPALEENHPPPR